MCLWTREEAAGASGGTGDLCMPCRADGSSTALLFRPSLFITPWPSSKHVVDQKDALMPVEYAHCSGSQLLESSVSQPLPQLAVQV